MLDSYNLRLSPKACEGKPEEITSPACFVIGDDFLDPANQPRMRQLLDRGFSMIDVVHTLLSDAGKCSSVSTLSFLFPAESKCAHAHTCSLLLLSTPCGFRVLHTSFFFFPFMQRLLHRCRSRRLEPLFLPTIRSARDSQKSTLIFHTFPRPDFVFLTSRTTGHDVSALIPNMRRAVLETFVPLFVREVAPAASKLPLAPGSLSGRLFALYRADMVLDSSLKPWIIEVNLSPNLTPSPGSASVRMRMWRKVVADTLRLIGLHDRLIIGGDSDEDDTWRGPGAPQPYGGIDEEDVEVLWEVCGAVGTREDCDGGLERALCRCVAATAHRLLLLPFTFSGISGANSK
jgi:hypothetical protein